MRYTSRNMLSEGYGALRGLQTVFICSISMTADCNPSRSERKIGVEDCKCSNDSCNLGWLKGHSSVGGTYI
jgi:hypothetical protein